MDWAISTCLVVFLSSLLSLLTEGTKLSSHINRVLGLVCLLIVFSPLVNIISKGELFNLTEDVYTQQTFLNYIESTYKEKMESEIEKVIKQQGISDYSVSITFNENETTVKSILIYLKNPTERQKSSIINEVSKKIKMDERIISICTE